MSSLHIINRHRYSQDSYECNRRRSPNVSRITIAQPNSGTQSRSRPAAAISTVRQFLIFRSLKRPVAAVYDRRCWPSARTGAHRALPQKNSLVKGSAKPFLVEVADHWLQRKNLAALSPTQP